MEKDDAQLIRDILSGDDAAFSTLVKKYHKSVHALVWRKIGDFHYAEEITQDTFLQVYTKLSTLRNPNQFAGWLYVIANRRCLNWIRKQKPTMQSLEGTLTDTVEKSSYARYVLEQRETETNEHQREIVKKLLERLPESERTVVTLYYLGEMTTKEISKFLGVSVRTINSRMHRARKRLQENEEFLVQEVFGQIQLPTNFIENIMHQVADMKPIQSSVGKPLLPWVSLGAAAILVMLLLGASDQHLIHFQKPYSFEAVSEPTIEIIDAPIVINVDSKPSVRNQIGRAVTPSKSSGTALQIDDTGLTSNTQEDAAKLPNSQWTQTNRPDGGDVFDILVSSDRTLYAAAPTGIYRLETDTNAWTHINTNIPMGEHRMPMAEHADTLYIVSTDEIFVSTDNGETWNTLCSRPKGHPIGLTIKETEKGDNPQAVITMYLALQDKGIFRSTDAGVHWKLLADGLENERIYAMTMIENTVFAGTNEGLYRLNSDVWQQLPLSLMRVSRSQLSMTSNGSLVKKRMNHQQYYL